MDKKNYEKSAYPILKMNRDLAKIWKGIKRSDKRAIFNEVADKKGLPPAVGDSAESPPFERLLKRLEELKKRINDL